MKTDKARHAAVAGALAIGGALTVSLNLTAFQGRPLAWLGTLTGMGMVAAAYKKDQRHHLVLEDYLEIVGDAYEELTGTLAGTLPVAKRAARSQIIVKYLPEKFRDPWESLVERALADDWFSEFTQRSKLVFGATRSGKSYLFIYETREFYRRYPEGRLLIGDLDFGSPNEDGVRNFWVPFGLQPHKPRFIRDTIEGVLEGIREFYEEMQVRLEWNRENQDQQIKRWQRWKLLLDELPAIFTEAKAIDSRYPMEVRVKPKEDPVPMKPSAFLELAIPALLYRGLKQQIEVTFGAQGKAVGEIGLNLQQQAQLNMLCLGSTALDKRVVGSIPGVDSAEPLIEKLKQTRKQPGCKYAAIAKIGDQVSVKVIPFIDPEAVEVILDDRDEVSQWLTEVLNGSLKGTLEDLSRDPSATLTKAVNLVNMECKQRSLRVARQYTSDPFYVAFKSYWEALKSSIKPTEEVLK